MYNVRLLVNSTCGTQYTVDQEEYGACCPFHGEKNPSFSMNANGKFCCHSCKIAGSSALEYAQLLFDFEDDLEVLDYLSQFKGSKNIFSATRPIAEKDHELRYQINLQAAQRYYALQFDEPGIVSQFDTAHSAAHAYLFSRGYEQETLEHFRVSVWPVKDHPIL